MHCRVANADTVVRNITHSHTHITYSHPPHTHTHTHSHTHRMLEEDTRFLSYNLRPGSTSDSTSLHSTDSLSSLRNMFPSHDQHTPLSPTPHSPLLTSPTEHTPLSPTLHSPLLTSPTEVHHKAPHLSAAFDYQDTESEEEGLGPTPSILLDDGLDTRIDYCEVVTGGEGKANTEAGVVNTEVGVVHTEAGVVNTKVGYVNNTEVATVCQKVEPTSTVLTSGGKAQYYSVSSYVCLSAIKGTVLYRQHLLLRIEMQK